MKIMHCITDGGRDRKERNDCTVRAVAIIEDIPYYQANDICKFMGRKDSRRMRGFTDAMALLGYKFHTTPISTLGRFLKHYPEKSFVASIRGHVFAVKRGVQFDRSRNGRRCRLWGYYEKEKLR